VCTSAGTVSSPAFSAAAVLRYPATRYHPPSSFGATVTGVSTPTSLIDLTSSAKFPSDRRTLCVRSSSVIATFRSCGSAMTPSRVRFVPLS